MTKKYYYLVQDEDFLNIYEDCAIPDVYSIEKAIKMAQDYVNEKNIKMINLQINDIKTDEIIDTIEVYKE